jgi:cytoskeleton protein RodZ
LATYRGAEDESYRGVGEELRAARERLGFGLEHISSALRIRRQHLEAIEEGRFEDLPGRVYAVGFLRGYADFVGLDGDVIVDRYQSKAAGPATNVELNFPEPPVQQWRMNFLPFAMALVIAGGAYAIWHALQTQDEVPRELIAELPADIAAETGVDPISDVAPIEPPTLVDIPANPTQSLADPDEPVLSDVTPVANAEIAAMPNVAAVAVPSSPLPPMPDSTPIGVVIAEATPQIDTTPLAIPESVVTTTVVPEVSVPEVTVEAPDPVVDSTDTTSAVASSDVSPLEDVMVEDGPPPPPPTAPIIDYEPRVYGQGNENARVVIRAIGDSWVQVQGADNDLLLTRILHPGDKFLVPDRADLVLSTGNAGGLEILVDGAVLPSFGEQGDVRRDISLEPQALTSGRAFERR